MIDQDNTPETDGQRFRRILGINIRRIREKRGIDRKALEHELQIKSSGGLSQIEGGNKGLPAWKIDKLEKFLHLPKGTLMESHEYTDEELEVMDAFMEVLGTKGNVWEILKHVLEPIRKKQESKSRPS